MAPNFVNKHRGGRRRASAHRDSHFFSPCSLESWHIHLCQQHTWDEVTGASVSIYTCTYCPQYGVVECQTVPPTDIRPPCQRELGADFVIQAVLCIHSSVRAVRPAEESQRNSNFKQQRETWHFLLVTDWRNEIWHNLAQFVVCLFVLWSYQCRCSHTLLMFNLPGSHFQLSPVSVFLLLLWEELRPNTNLPPCTHVHGNNNTYAQTHTDIHLCSQFPDSPLPTSPCSQLV